MKQMPKMKLAVSLFLCGAIVLGAMVTMAMAAGNKHVAEALEHAKEAVSHGKQGHADALAKHADAALKHAAVRKVRSGRSVRPPSIKSREGKITS